MNNRRSYKVASEIRAVIASKLLNMADERFALVTITSVVTSSDLKECKVYWNVTGSKERIAETKKAFEAAAGFFKHAIGESVQLRRVPNLRFYYDDTLDTVEEVEKLLARTGISNS